MPEVIAKACRGQPNSMNMHRISFTVAVAPPLPAISSQIVAEHLTGLPPAEREGL